MDYDYDEDNIDLEDEDDSCCDDWEDEEEEKEKEAEAARKAKEEEEERKAEERRKKQEKRERLAALKGELEADELDIEELDGAADKEYRDRLTQHEAEVSFQETSKFAAKPIATMRPETKEEFDQMGTKLGKCLRTFRNTKFFCYSLNLILHKACDKLDLDHTQSLSKKLNVIATERAKEIKDAEKRKKREEETVGGLDLGEGEVIGEGRNDLKGDAGEIDDFM